MLEQLREAIERLLDDGQSYTDIGIDRIVGEAGIPRSTFYVYFEDRSDLLRALFHDLQRRLGSYVAPWWALDADAGRDDVHRVMDELVRGYKPFTALMAAVHDAAGYDPAMRELVSELIERSTDDMTAHLERGQREGFVNPDLLPRPTAAYLTRMVERTMHQVVRTADEPELADAVEALTEITWQTLYAPARERGGGVGGASLPLLGRRGR